MRNEYFMTPRQAAHSIAIDWIEAAYYNRTDDVIDSDHRPSFQRKVRKQLAKLREELLDSANLDSTALRALEDDDGE